MTATLLEQRLNSALTGKYAIEREVGRGGMATVYLARDIRHDRNVALKVLEPELGAVLGAERFLAEIKVTANLQHPNLLPLFDSGEADGLLFYVMPFVEGESLRARLDREQQLPVDEAIRISTAIANGLQYAHGHGVIHRDLKPENILLQSGQPVIADFGIALAVSKAGGARITQTGLSLGTPQYMSPEQATGDRTVDARSDIYSLGALTYEMLTGEPPHVGNSAQVIIAKLMTEDVRPLTIIRRTVPPHIDAAVRRALEKLAADRFATAGEFAAALSNKGTDQSIAQYASSTTLPAARKQLRSQVSTYAAWALVVLLVGAIAWMKTRPTDAPDTPVVRMHLDLPPGNHIMVAGFPVRISPQGDRIAYVVQGPNGYRTLTQRTSELVGREIANNSLSNMAFSPDGKWIAYTTSNEVRKIPVDGGASIALGKVTARPNAISWGTPELIIVGTWNGLWSLPSNGGTPRFVPGSDSTRSSAYVVVLSDGKTAIRAVSSTSDDYALHALSLTSGKDVPLGIRSITPLGVLDGNLVYATLNGELMAVPFDEKALRATGDPIQLEEGIDGIGLSASGTLAYVSGRAASRLVLSADGREDEVLPVEPKNYNSPRFSPDGRRIAMSVVGGATNDIWVFDIAAKTSTKLTSEGENGVPEWSPDGSRVLYRSDRSKGVKALGNTEHRGIWWQPADGSGAPEKLFEQSDDPVNEALVSPDGKWLLYRTSPEATHPRDILALPLSGDRKPQLIVGGAGSEIMPRLSPDGKWLAYVADESGRFEVFVRPFPNSGARVQVSSDGGTEPLWSKDGKTIFYHTIDGITGVSVTTGASFSIVSRKRALRVEFINAPTHQSYDIAPDGRFLVLKPAQPEQPAVIVHNWRRELREKMAKK